MAQELYTSEARRLHVPVADMLTLKKDIPVCVCIYIYIDVHTRTCRYFMASKPYANKPCKYLFSGILT